MSYFIQPSNQLCRAKKRLIKNAHSTAHKGRLLLTLLLLLLTATTTWADNVMLKSDTKKWTNGNTYVTNGDVTIADRITVEGDVTLILTDGCTLNAKLGIEVRVGNSLTIEGGTNGTGTLTIKNEGGTRAGIGGGYKKVGIKKDPTQYGKITINGGTVNAKGGDQCAGIGGDFNSELDGNGKIIINGGIVNATGGNKASGIGGSAKGGCGDIVINGGQVTATGGGDGPGIGPGKGAAGKTSGSLVLGWTNTTDFIKVTGVKSNLNVVYGFSNRLRSIRFADNKKFNISGGGEATIKDIKNLESVELIPKGSEQHQLSVATISGISASYDLTGSYLDIPFSVIDAEEKTLTLGTDYTATLGTTSQESDIIHITEGGKYTLTITGMGSYAGSKSVDFEVISIGFKKDANGDDYINMPKTGIYYYANIPEGVSSFKVYDDGGAKAQYSNNYDGGLVLIAPDHHVLQLTGTVTAEVQANKLDDYLMVYDGVYDGVSTSAQKIGDKYGSESGENIGTLISSGKQMTLTFHSDPSGQRDGLDLTATLKRDLGSCVIADIDDQTYIGSAIEPAVVITYKGTALVKDVDYEVTYSGNTIVGTATITITGKGNYAGKTSKIFTIVKATPTVTAPIAVADLEYKGSAQELVTTGDTDFGTLLYSLDDENYSEGIPTAMNAGTYTVYYKVEGSDNWNKVEAQSITVIIDKATPYVKTTPTASAITYGQTLSDSELNDGVIQISENIATEIAGTLLWSNSSVKPSVTDSENTEYGVTFTPNDRENCKSVTMGVTLTVNKATPIVTAPIANTLIYNGCEQELVTAGSTDFGTLLYSLNDDTYSENIPTRTGAGTYTVYYKVEGSDNWNAVAAQTIQATIVKDVTCSDISITIPEQTYTGSELTPVITMKDGETELTENTDYTVTAPSVTIQDAGNYTYTITGKGNYSGEKAATFTIAPKLVTNDGISIDTPSQEWTGNELTPVITVKDGETVLTENTDYTVTAPSVTIQDSGNYTYTITGQGNYAGSRETTFTIKVKQVTVKNDLDEDVPAATGDAGITEDQNGTTLTLITPAENAQPQTVSIPQAVEVDHVDIDRIFVSGKACTLYLPFSIAADKIAGGTFYTFAGVDMAVTPWEVQYTPVTTGDIAANTPYIFLPDDTEDGKIVVNNGSAKVTVCTANPHTSTQGEWNFIGTYERIKWTHDTTDPEYNDVREAEIGNIYGFAAEEVSGATVGQFVKVGNNVWINPMRAYLKYNEVLSAPSMDGDAASTELPSSMKVVIVKNNGETTGISSTTNYTNDKAWYTLDGRKVANGQKPTAKGIYIHNGRKEVVK